MLRTTTFSVRLPDELRREVDEFRKGDQTIPLLCREGGGCGLYAANRADYLAAIEEGEREADKGVFISGDAVKTWLLSWGTDE